MSCAVFGISYQATCTDQFPCKAKNGCVISQNNCLIRKISIFEFRSCSGQSLFTFNLTNLDASTQIEHRHNNVSGYFHCNDSTTQEQYSETYIARLALNISIHLDKLNCTVACDFYSGVAINANGSCGMYDVISEDRLAVCPNDSTIVSVGIPVNDQTMTMMGNMWYEINLGIIHYCTVMFSANVIKTSSISCITNDPTSLSPTCTTSSCNHIPFKSTPISELLGISSSVNVHTSPQQLTFTIGLTVGISASILVLAMLLMILIVVVWTYARRRAVRQKQYSEHHDGSHSVQEQSELPASANVYEQVHLSPSTDITPSAESGNMPWEPQTDFHGIYSHINTEKPDSATQETEMNTLDDPTYDVVGKENNKEGSNISHDGPPISSNSRDHTAVNNKASSLVENEPKRSKEALEEMYAVVNKKQKKDEDAPPVPPHTVEELYTAVAKNSKVDTTGDEDKDYKDNTGNEEVAPPLPPHTVEELYTAVVKKPKGNTVKDKEDTPTTPPYTIIDTAVKGDLKDEAENEDVAPPIPPHTVEELFTAVQKKLKGSAKVEEVAPPIPPYMPVDKL